MAMRPKIKNLYYLKLEQAESSQQGSSKLSVKAVQNWVTDLPAANMGMIARKTTDILTKINSSNLGAVEQFEILEVLQPVVFSIHQYIQDKSCGHTLPLSEKPQKIVELQITILRSYATAYWSVLQRATKQLTSRQFNKLTPILVQRLIRLLSNILVAHYLVHLHEPTWLWMDLHSLFHMLPEKVRTTTKVKEISVTGENITTIQATYLQIVALRCSNPYSLFDREILRLNFFLGSWATSIKLTQLRPGAIPLGYFMSMDDDIAPEWAGDDLEMDEDSVNYQIDLRDLMETFKSKATIADSNLGRYFSATAFPPTHNRFDPELVVYLRRQWEGKRTCRLAIIDDSLHREVTIGLNSISDIVKGDKNTKDLIFRAEIAASKTFKSEFNASTQISIGSLVGHREVKSKYNTFSLGIVNSISTPKTDGITQFELKSLCSNCKPVSIELVPDKKEEALKPNEVVNSTQANGLTYIKKSRKGLIHYLLVESRGFKEQDVIIVSSASKTYSAVLLKQRTLGQGYVELEFERMQQVEITEVVPATGYDFL